MLLTEEDWERISNENADENMRNIQWSMSQVFMGDDFEEGIWNPDLVPPVKSPVRNKVYRHPFPDHMTIEDQPIDGPYAYHC